MNSRPLLFVFLITASLSAQALNQKDSPELRQELALRAGAVSAVNEAKNTIEEAKRTNPSSEKRNEMIETAIQKSRTAVESAREAFTQTKSALRQAEETMNEYQSERENFFFDASIRTSNNEKRASAKATFNQISSIVEELKRLVHSLRSAKVIASYTETEALATLKKALDLQSAQNTTSSCYQAVAD